MLPILQPAYYWPPLDKKADIARIGYWHFYLLKPQLDLHLALPARVLFSILRVG